MTIEEQDSFKWMIDALDHLQQYRRYTDSTAKQGMAGCIPTSQFSPKYLEGALETAIKTHLWGKTPLDHREVMMLEGVKL